MPNTLQEFLVRDTQKAADELVEKTSERWAEAEMHRLRGSLLLSANRHDAAEGCYNQALAVARRQKASFWELRAARDMARLWHDQGKRNDARDLLTPIYSRFSEGFDTSDLKEAETLLGALTS